MAKLLGHDIVTTAELEAFEVKISSAFEARVAAAEENVKSFKTFLKAHISISAAIILGLVGFLIFR